MEIQCHLCVHANAYVIVHEQIAIGTPESQPVRFYGHGPSKFQKLAVDLHRSYSDVSASHHPIPVELHSFRRLHLPQDVQGIEIRVVCFSPS